VSRPPRPVGRPVRTLEAVTGTQHSLQVTPDTTTEHTVRALVSAADVLKAEILPDDRWIQIEGAEFRALDFNGFGFARTDRSLIITGTAHQ
jgi:hypothetical protein